MSSFCRLAWEINKVRANEKNSDSTRTNRRFGRKCTTQPFSITKKCPNIITPTTHLWSAVGKAKLIRREFDHNWSKAASSAEQKRLSTYKFEFILIMLSAHIYFTDLFAAKKGNTRIECSGRSKSSLKAINAEIELIVINSFTCTLWDNDSHRFYKSSLRLSWRLTWLKSIHEKPSSELKWRD